LIAAASELVVAATINPPAPFRFESPIGEQMSMIRTRLGGCAHKV